MAKNSQEYWAERARADKKKVIRTSERGIDNLKGLLKKNLDEVQAQIKAFYEKYGDNPAENLSYAEFQKYKANLRRMAKLNPQDKILQKLAKQDIPKYRIDRLRQLETDLQIQLTEATRGQEAGIYKTLEDVAKVSQATTALRFKNTLDITFNRIADRKMQQILSSDWSGKNWSERLWKDREKVGKKVSEIVETGIPQGKSMQEMTRDLKDATGSSFNDAFRLIRTEASHVDGQVLLDSFKQAQRELGYTKYIYDAFLDSRTSIICKDLDNKIFNIDDAEIGVNFPPMHPNCRSTCVLDESSIDESLTEDSKEEEKEEEIQEEFKPATTKEEAKEYANRFVKDGNSTFDNDITLDNLNQFNEQMTYLTKKYNYNEYETIGSFTARGKKKPSAHANRKLLEIEKTFGTNTDKDYTELFGRNVINYQANIKKSIDDWQQYVGNPKYDQKKINKYIKEWTQEAKFIRYNAFSSSDNIFKDIVNHEFGHSLMFRAMDREIKAGGTYIAYGNTSKYIVSKSATKTYKIVSDTLREARKTGDIYKISRYANTDIDEFFAECYAIYERGVEKLPKYINNMIKEVLSI